MFTIHETNCLKPLESKLIYFVPDQAEFEENQGCGLFFEDSLRRGAVCLSKNELVKKLREYLNDTQQTNVTKLLYPDYFQDLIGTCNKRLNKVSEER